MSIPQYHAMIREGVLTDDDPVELLEGWLVQKMPKNPAHCNATQLARDGLATMVGPSYFVASERPVTLPDSEPEPDVTVARGKLQQFRERHPGPSDIALLVEVADATLVRDQRSKKRIYAKAGIAVYWIVNLVDRRIEVYTEATGPTEKPDYRSKHFYGATKEVPVVLDGREVGRLKVKDLLP
jgi:Uma2 family endonuclease